MTKMKVSLISYTPNAEKVVAAAARLCYSPRSAETIMEDFSDQEVEKFLTKLVDLGHSSPFEHASFTFAIDGVSRALSHQLVRHRIASFSQKSQRYVKDRDFSYLIPPSISAEKNLVDKYNQAIDVIGDLYNELLNSGIPAEDARFILPNACTTNFVVTMNARSLLHFFELRCCNRAQWEIRELAKLMLAEVKDIAPTLFSKAGATCIVHGICYEGDMCCKKGNPNIEIRTR